MGKQWKQREIFFFGGGGSKIPANADCSHEIERCLLIGRKVMTNLDSILKSRDITLQTKSIWSKLWVFQLSFTDVRVGLQRKLSAKELMPLNCGVREDSWESLGLKEIQPVHPRGNQSWMLTGRTDVEAETSTLWPPDAKNWLIGKDPDFWERLKVGGEGDDRGWDGWMHHQLDGHEFE